MRYSVQESPGINKRLASKHSGSLLTVRLALRNPLKKRSNLSLKPLMGPLRSDSGLENFKASSSPGVCNSAKAGLLPECRDALRSSISVRLMGIVRIFPVSCWKQINIADINS